MLPRTLVQYLVGELRSLRPQTMVEAGSVGPRVQILVRELRSHKPCSAVRLPNLIVKKKAQPKI